MLPELSEIARRRRGLGLTQADLARRAGVRISSQLLRLARVVRDESRGKVD